MLNLAALQKNSMRMIRRLPGMLHKHDPDGARGEDFSKIISST